MSKFQLRQVVIACALISVGVMAPNVDGDTEVETWDFPRNLVFGHFEGGSFVAYQPLRTEEISVRWESRPDDVIVLTHAPAGFEISGVWADSRGGAAAILVEFANASQGTQEWRLFRATADGWSESRRSASAGALIDFALAPNGDAYVLGRGRGVDSFSDTLFVERGGVWSVERERFPFLALRESLVVDESGVAHVCGGRPGEVIVWSADGARTVIHRGAFTEIRRCVLHVGADGAGVAVTSVMPLFGESGCSDPDPDCTESRSAWSLHRERADGSWDSVDTGAPSWNYARFAETDGGDRYLFTDSRSSGLLAYAVTDGGLVPVIALDRFAWDAARWPGESVKYAHVGGWSVAFVTE